MFHSKYKFIFMLENAGSAKGKGGKSKGSTDTNLQDFTAEYAKSSRSKCISCENKIEKVSVSILLSILLKGRNFSSKVD